MAKKYNQGRDYTKKDIFEIFIKKAKKYPENLIDPTSKKKKKRKIDYKMFHLIIFTYFECYVLDLFYGVFKTMYSPFIGKMELGRLDPKGFGNKDFPNPTTSFGFIWYQRISKRHWCSIRLKKIRGTGNRAYEIFRKFQESKDVSALKLAITKIRERLHNRTLFDL